MAGKRNQPNLKFENVTELSLPPFYCEPSVMESLDVNNVLKFLQVVHNLKYYPRKGWEYCGVRNPERIAGHMYAMGIMTFLLGNDSGLNRLQCLQLALVHDLAECIVGDITPRDNIPTDIKHALEDTAMKELTVLLGDEVGQMIYNIYKEYEAQSTPEAKFVKDLDRFDMIFTAASYEKRDSEPGKLQEFFDHTQGKFHHPFIKKLVKSLEDQRAELNRQVAEKINRI